MTNKLQPIVAAILAASLIAGCATTASRKNLLPNPGFENARDQQLPPRWQTISMGVPAKVSVDTSEKRAGRSSIRLDAADFTRSYVLSEEFPVVPGEEIDGSAWVKVENAPPEHGTVIMIAEFLDPSGQDPSVEKFNVADLKKSRWQHIKGSVKVPPNAVALRLRLGFSYAKGTCWWDDVRVTARTPLAARVDLPEPRLSPAMQSVPVLIVNRDGRAGDVPMTLTLGKQTAKHVVTLDGNATQRVEVPIKIPPPGKVDLRLELGEQRQKTKPRFATTMPVFQVPHALVFPPVSPTHWVTEDGPAKIEARIDLAMTDAQRRGATLRAEVRDSSGKAIATWQASGEIADGITEFTIDAPSAREGDYTIVAELTPRDGKPIAATQPWHVIPRRRAKVTINDDGYPVHDSKAIFPLGIFNGGKWQEQAEAGFTVTHAYNAARIPAGSRPPDHEAKKWLDQSEANGMKMLLMIPMRQAIRGDWDAIRRRIRMFRNHPALLAWDEEEGFARGDFKPDTLARLRQIIDEEDPHHPFMVGDGRSQAAVRSTDRSDFFPDEMDLGMWWWYPFPLKARAADALEGEEATAGTELELPSFLTTAKTKKPIWVGIQSYKKKNARYPTPEEYRCQAYLTLTAGAKGLMWYGGSVTGGVFLAPEEGRWDALKKVARELHDLSPELLGKTLEPPKVTPSNSPINVLLKQSADRTILITVNRSTRPVDAIIQSPLFRNRRIKRVYEGGAPKHDGEIVTQHFAPFAVHVYELTR